MIIVCSTIPHVESISGLFLHIQKHVYRNFDKNNKKLPCARIKTAFAAKDIMSWIFSPANITCITGNKNHPKCKVRKERDEKVEPKMK